MYTEEGLGPAADLRRDERESLRESAATRSRPAAGNVQGCQLDATGVLTDHKRGPWTHTDGPTAAAAQICSERSVQIGAPTASSAWAAAAWVPAIRPNVTPRMTEVPTGYWW